MSQELLAILMLVSFFVLLLAGIPVGMTLAVSGFVFGFLGFGTTAVQPAAASHLRRGDQLTLLAIPLFVFMGVMLENSRLAEDLIDVIGHLAGCCAAAWHRHHLVGVLMGATTGIVGATVVTLGLLTLPAMLRRGYDKGFACGAICASGTLGQIIPPSLVLILLADILNESVGTLFAAAMIPGLMLAGIYCAYIIVLGIVRPEMVPAVPPEERALLPRPNLVRSHQGGAAAGRACRSGARLDHRRHRGAIRSSLDGRARIDPDHRRHRRARLRVLRETCQATIKITAMMMFILICAQVFASRSAACRARRLVHDLFALLPGGINADIWFLMVIIFILGFFIEWIEISYIAVPLFLPVFMAAVSIWCGSRR